MLNVLDEEGKTDGIHINKSKTKMKSSLKVKKSCETKIELETKTTKVVNKYMYFGQLITPGHETTRAGTNELQRFGKCISSLQNKSIPMFQKRVDESRISTSNDT